MLSTERMSRFVRGPVHGWVLAALVSVLAFVVVAIGAGVAAGARPKTCSGTLHSPGVLTGNYPAGAVIKGTCKVSAGVADVHGTLTLAPQATLLAYYALNSSTGKAGSELIVNGNLVMQRGATLILGCSPTHLTCADDPDPGSPTLSTSGHITGDLKASGARGIVVHNSTIDGSVRQTGGGAGVRCKKIGVFQLLKNPVYSDYEDLTIRRSLVIADLRSCWLGLARDHIGRNLTLKHDQLNDPDAIEVLANVIKGNLSCAGNSQVWDSTEAGTVGDYPRKSEPNTVRGKRHGQCRLASPPTQGGKAGPGAF